MQVLAGRDRTHDRSCGFRLLLGRPVDKTALYPTPTLCQAFIYVIFNLHPISLGKSVSSILWMSKQKLPRLSDLPKHMGNEWRARHGVYSGLTVGAGAFCQLQACDLAA